MLKDRPEWLMIAIIVAIMSVWASCSYRYAKSWENELTLWQHAVEIAPSKPRPHINLALALMERHQLTRASAIMDETDVLIQESGARPLYDQRDAVAAQARNRTLLWAASRIPVKP